MADDKLDFKDLPEITEINEKVAYFRKQGRVIKDQILTNEAGEKVIVTSDGKRGKGRLKGVMVAFCNGDDSVKVGFSMCHPLDRWDYVDGVHKPGWGKYIANERAEKWFSKIMAVKHENLAIALAILDDETDTPTQEDRQMFKDAVVIPDTMYDSLCSFVYRCKKYYKDKRFPVWVDQL